MSLSFVIPIYNNYSLLHQLLWDIFKNCTRPNEILLIDDYSDERELQRGVEWWIGTDMLPIEYIKKEKNDGFLLTSNYGLKKAKSDTVSLVSTDVRIHKDLVAWTKERSLDNAVLGGRIIDWDSGWNTFNKVTYPYVEGWLLTTSKVAWEKLGYFDEQFAPSDMEDVDFSTKAQKVNMLLEPYPDKYVSHLGAASIGYTAERELITQRNKKLFEAKWAK